jgi:hypothetical protein
LSAARSWPHAARAQQPDRVRRIGKPVELLKELAPHLRRMALLFNPE